MRPRVAASLIVVGIAAVPACSAASNMASSAATKAQATGKPRITTRPSTGRPTTRFVVSFTAPQGSRIAGGTTRRYQVSASSAPHHGCVPTASQSVLAPRDGARVSAKLAPAGGRSWCTGTFHGKIIETFQPVCPPLRLCPAFIGVFRTIGTFTFDVKADPA